MKDTNNMREQFEAAYEAKSFSRNGRFDRAVLTRGGDGEYVIPQVQSAWWGWQASREAVVIEFPAMGDAQYWESFPDVEGESFVFPKYLGHLQRGITDQGLKVKP